MSPATGVSWRTSDPTIAAINADGLITGKLTGRAIIYATSGSLSGQTQVDVTPGAPAVVLVYAGNGQFAAAGARLSDPLCTNVKDAAGNLIIGAIVTYTVLSGGGKLADPTLVATDATGIAISGLWTLGPNPGPQTVMASSSGATAVTFTATAR